MGPFLRSFETRKSTIAATLSRRPLSEVGGKHNGKRWFYGSRGPGNGYDENVQREQESRREQEIDELREGDETTSGKFQEPKTPYWKRFEILNTNKKDLKTFFRTPEWMKSPWSKEDIIKEWWVGKDATEKSQSQEAYGDIYPLEIPSMNEQDGTSDDSDMVSLIRKVGVGVPNNLAQRRILLKEAKLALGYKHVLRALQIRDPHMLLKVLVKMSEVDNYGVNYSPLLDIPPNTFSEILRLLDPKHFFGRYKRLLQDFHHRDLLELRIDTLDYEGTYRAYTVYLWHLHRIIMKRQIKYPLSLSEYKMLLKAAKFTGHQTVADLTWQSLASNQYQVTENRRILPDVECFNYYMSTMCWSDVLSPFHSDKLRVVPHYEAQRQWRRRPHLFDRHRIGENGIKTSVTRLFREMFASGLVGDEETFLSLMVSASREKDVETAQAILKRVWNIDIDSPNRSNDSKLNKIVPESPLYPSQKLIRTVAHIWCINNDLPMAMRVIDQISRRYSIDISNETWQDLLEWTAVFAKKRGSALHEEKGLDEGMLPPLSMDRVWEKMTEHYNIKPTIPMYNIYIRHLLSRRKIGEAQVKIIEAHQLHQKLSRIVHRYRILYENSLSRRNPDSAVTAIRQRDFIFHRLKLRVSRMYMRQWVNYLIYSPAKYLSTYHADWAFQNIPNIVKRYKSFLRGQMSYQTYTGYVRLETGKPQETKIRIWRRTYGDMRSRRRRLRKVMGKILKKREEHRYNQRRVAAGGKYQLAAQVCKNTGGIMQNRSLWKMAG